MKNVILVKIGEIHLKGLNRPFFERTLIEHIRKVVKPLGGTTSIAQSRIYVRNIPDEKLDETIDKLKCIFGIYALSPAKETEKSMEAIINTTLDMLKSENLKGTFKIRARRSDKRFPIESPEICVKVGEAVLEAFPDLMVDVHNPDHIIQVEVREQAYVYVKEISAVGGMPIGTNGKAMLLLSGGIDSPVAGYMIAKRGVMLEAVHFHSFPHTSERAKQKVLDLAKIVAKYCGPIKVHVVSFTELQEAIYSNCPDKSLTVVMRRYMMRIAQEIARANGANALITGESIGQVASQTMESLCCTDSVVSMPVFRPLIGNDKLEIMDIAKKIGTYETSILPFEDCCTVFTPKHPVTHPTIELMQEAEACFDAGAMVERAIKEAEVIIVSAE